MIYLIPLEAGDRFVEIPPEFYAEAYENKNPDFEEHGPAVWATPEALEALGDPELVDDFWRRQGVDVPEKGGESGE